jgi:molybdopterin synthase sulfur carrier subunit
MATVWLPAAAQDLTGGESTVEVDGKTMSEVVRNLDRAYPGLSRLLIKGNSLRPGITIAIDGVIGNRALSQSLRPDSEVQFIPAIFGG